MPNPENIIGKGFKPGQSGNPAGRPKGLRNFSTIIRKALNEKIEIPVEGGGKKKIRLDQAMVIAQIKTALKGNTKAFNAIIDRVDGKVAEKHELTGKDGQPLPAALPPLQVVVQGVPGGEEPNVQ